MFSSAGRTLTQMWGLYSAGMKLLGTLVFLFSPQRRNRLGAGHCVKRFQPRFLVRSQGERTEH
jgi:hypothetical protein